MVFDQRLAPGTARVAVAGPTGPVEAGGQDLSHGDHNLEVQLGPGQGPGVYTVSWQVTATDGGVMDGTYLYAVGSAVTGGSGLATDQPGQWWTAAPARPRPWTPAPERPKPQSRNLGKIAADFESWPVATMTLCLGTI